MSKKIITIIGARPQFVKAATISRALTKTNIEEILVHTGQHFNYEMSELFFDEMEIPKPKYNLGINSLSHGAMTGRMLEKIEKVLIIEKPDWVIVYGDTNSTLAGALAASKLKIPVAHVEAGLRSFNLEMPEEINRILTDRISKLLFCPTITSVKNLHNEGFQQFECKIEQVGDVMYDAALYYSQKSATVSHIIENKSLNNQKFVLVTLHRQENTDNLNRLKQIISALNTIHKDMQIVLPVHPRTRKILEQTCIETHFTPIDPVSYFDMIELLKNCSLVMTDSGGLQKEAFFFRKNCITLRDQTEWTELIDGGYNLLVGAEHKNILTAFTSMLKVENDFENRLYGDGDAAKQIIRIIDTQ
jgi:UDP-GlcNAc3NAcA epimerase